MNINRESEKLPQRTCLVCRKVLAKKELIRIVRTPAGNLEVDTKGKKSGRGAYLCSAANCWESGLKGGQIERNLKISLTPEEREQLIKAGREFIIGVVCDDK